MPPNKNSFIRVRDPLVALLWIFGYFYLAAIAAYVTSVLGVFQFSPFFTRLLPMLGLPWNLLAENLPQTIVLGFSLKFWATLISPAINLLILYLLKRWARPRT